MKQDKIKIAPEDNRGIDIGEYNSGVNRCIACNILLSAFEEHCIGFGKPKWINLLENTLAVVYQCNQCHTIQWHHTNAAGYRRWLRYKNERNNKEEK